VRPTLVMATVPNRSRAGTCLPILLSAPGGGARRRQPAENHRTRTRRGVRLPSL